MTPDEAIALCGRQARVRVYDGAGLRTVMAEGRVIGYAPHPSLLLAHDDGSQSQWMTTLPIEEIPVPETTTQPPLTPGQHVLVECEAVETALEPSLQLRPAVVDGPWQSGYRLNPGRYRWRPMPAEDSPDAAHVARLEDFRRDVLMALCTEDDDEERTDEQVITRIRQLVSIEHDHAWAMTNAGPRGDKPLHIVVSEIVAERGQALGQLTVMERRVIDAEAKLDRIVKLLTYIEDGHETVDANNAEAHIRGLIREYGMALGELDRMRPVVEAAEAWRDILLANAADLLVNPIRRAVVLAVDAFRAGQKAPTEAPASTLSDQQPEIVPDSGGPSTEPTEAPTAVSTKCRSSYYTDTGRRQHPGDREVRCGRPKGHPGKHQELDDDGEVLAGWEPERVVGNFGLIGSYISNREFSVPLDDEEPDDDPEPVDLISHHDPIVGATFRACVVGHPARPLQVGLRRDSEPHPCCIARIPRAAATQLAWDILTTYDPDGAPFDEAARLAHQAMRREMDHLERELTKLGVTFATPFDLDHPNAVDAALMEIDQLRALVAAKPVAAQPQPTDAPSRRDWDTVMREVARKRGEHLSSGMRSDLVAALRLDELEDELAARGEVLAKRTQEALRLREDRDNWRAAQRRALRDREAVEAEMDRRLAEAAGKLDALRAERDQARARYIQARLDAGWEINLLHDGIARIADELESVGVALDDQRIWAGRLRALLAAPPATTPDGTGTATMDGAA